MAESAMDFYANVKLRLDKASLDSIRKQVGRGFAANYAASGGAARGASFHIPSGVSSGMTSAALHGFSASSMKALGYKMVGSLAPALAGIVAMGAGINALTLRMSKFTKEMLELATATDETVGSFARYSSQMAGVGLSKNEVSASLKSLTALGSAWSYGQVDDEQLTALAFMGIDFDRFKEASSANKLQMLVKGGFKLKAEGGEEAYNYPLSQFGDTGGRVKKILKLYSTYEEYQKELAKSAENATELSEETTKTYLDLSKSWERAKQNLSNLVTTVFQPFASALTPVFDWAGTTFKDLKKKWEDSELGQSTLNFLTKFGQKAKDLFDGVGSVFSTAKKKWDESPLKEAALDWIANAKTKMGDFFGKVETAYSTLKTDWDNSALKPALFTFIEDAKKATKQGATDLLTAFCDIKEIWDESETKQKGTEFVKDFGGAVYNGLKSGSDILASLLAAWNGWTGKEAIYGIVTEDLPSAVDKIGGGVASVADWVVKEQQKVQKLWDESGAKDFIGSTFDKIAEVTGNYYTWLKDGLDKMLGIGKYAKDEDEEEGVEVPLAIPQKKTKFSLLSLPSETTPLGGVAKPSDVFKDPLTFKGLKRTADLYGSVIKAYTKADAERGETLFNASKQRYEDSGQPSWLWNTLFKLGGFLGKIPFIGSLFYKFNDANFVQWYGAKTADIYAADFTETMANRPAIMAQLDAAYIPLGEDFVEEGRKRREEEMAKKENDPAYKPDFSYHYEFPPYWDPDAQNYSDQVGLELTPEEKDQWNVNLQALANLLSTLNLSNGNMPNPDRTMWNDTAVGTLRNGPVVVVNNNVLTKDPDTTIETTAIDSVNSTGGSTVPVTQFAY